jgi:hypothetical protein
VCTVRQGKGPTLVVTDEEADFDGTFDVGVAEPGAAFSVGVLGTPRPRSLRIPVAGADLKRGNGDPFAVDDLHLERNLSARDPRTSLSSRKHVVTHRYQAETAARY